MAEKNFPFIVLNGPKLNDPGARRIIRKQAMKDVGNARRKRGDYGRVNLRQVPVFEGTKSCNRKTEFPIRTSDSSESSDETLDFSPDTAESSASTDPTEIADEEVSRELTVLKRKFPVAELHAQNTPLSYAAISLFSNYETARAKFSVDVADLAILTNFNVGKSSIPILSADPMRLASLLGHQQWSYLQYVPSLYGGSSPCLTAATNCLLSKVKGILSPYDHCKEVTMRLYTKALRTLQEAISSESECMDAEILCATQLLSLHELLDPSRDAAWSQHVHGSARLVRYRTPNRFKSEFEKALFASHVGAVVFECLMSGTHCYLEEPEWMNLYRSSAQDKDYLDDRSSLTINIRALMFSLPGVWHDVSEVVTGPQLFNDGALASLAARCRDKHQRYIDWMEDYKGHCVRLSLATPPPSEIAMRRELFGASLECLILVKRLLATVCDPERERLETETQALAHLILDLQKQPSSKHSWLFAGHEVGIAHTVMLTKDQWEGHYTYESEEERKLATRTRCKQPNGYQAYSDHEIVTWTRAVSSDMSHCS